MPPHFPASILASYASRYLGDQQVSVIERRYHEHHMGPNVLKPIFKPGWQQSIIDNELEACS